MGKAAEVTVAAVNGDGAPPVVQPWTIRNSNAQLGASSDGESWLRVYNIYFYNLVYIHMYNHV